MYNKIVNETGLSLVFEKMNQILDTLVDYLGVDFSDADYDLKQNKLFYNDFRLGIKSLLILCDFLDIINNV